MYLRLICSIVAVMAVAAALCWEAYREIGWAGVGIVLLLETVIGFSAIAFLSSGPGGLKQLVTAFFPEDREGNDLE